jgi:hypothetical protein
MATTCVFYIGEGISWFWDIPFFFKLGNLRCRGNPLQLYFYLLVTLLFDLVIFTLSFGYLFIAIFFFLYGYFFKGKYRFFFCYYFIVSIGGLPRPVGDFLKDG